MPDTYMCHVYLLKIAIILYVCLDVGSFLSDKCFRCDFLGLFIYALKIYWSNALTLSDTFDRLQHCHFVQNYILYIYILVSSLTLWVHIFAKYFNNHADEHWIIPQLIDKLCTFVSIKLWRHVFFDCFAIFYDGCLLYICTYAYMYRFCIFLYNFPKRVIYILISFTTSKTLWRENARAPSNNSFKRDDDDTFVFLFGQISYLETKDMHNTIAGGCNGSPVTHDKSPLWQWSPRCHPKRRLSRNERICDASLKINVPRNN